MRFKMKIWDDSGKPLDKAEGSMDDLEKEFKKLKKNKLGFKW